VATAEPAYFPGLATRASEDTRDFPRHSAVVRITHWINALSFLGLAISGAAILIAHPRFYWGEAGGIGTPSVLDLPLPYLKGGPSGWGRRLHFLSAWVCILNGLFYVISGIVTRHFRKDLIPAKADLKGRSMWRVVSNHLRLKRPGAETSLAYDVLQRLTYLGVVFVMLPLMIWTAFAMSPAIVSVFPFFVTTLGGQETARTIHFFAADLLILFLVVHIMMVSLAGFTDRVRTMIMGRPR
jgi:thiosulfate reductase cytochrome b subunit